MSPFTSLYDVVVKYVIILNVHHIQKGSHSGAVSILLLALTFPHWYHQVYKCYFSDLEDLTGLPLILTPAARY